MRWFVLYARSRHVPASLVALVVSTGLLGWAALSAGPGYATFPPLLLMCAAITLSIGLSGQDLALDRAAAMPWPRRRAAHVVLIGVVSAVAFLAVQSFGDELAPLGPVVLDSAGVAGLVALGAALFGGQFAWTVPFVWFAVALFVPESPDPFTEVVTWMFQPPGTAAATWTALGLGVLGTAAYAVRGARR